MQRDNYKYSYISTATTTQVHTGKGKIVGILVGETSAGSIKVIDGTSGTTTNVAELKASIVEGWYELNVNVSAGIRIVTAGASKITVVYSNK